MIKKNTWRSYTQCRSPKGFTLIELLVVVLIIGILAAIAVTQYKKSVLKSKYSTLLPLTKALHDSQEMFDLTRGYYTDNFSDLELPDNATVNDETATVNNNTFTLGNNKRHIYIKATKSGLNNNYVMYQSKSKYFPNEIHCEAKTDNYLANWLCKDELGGTKLDRSLTEGYTDYVIRGTGNGFFPIDYMNYQDGSYFNYLDLTNGDTCTSTINNGCEFVNASNGATCYSFNNLGCTASKFNNATCVGSVQQSCKFSSFVNSTCEAIAGNNVCSVSGFRNSTCIGDGNNSCSTFDSRIDLRDAYKYTNSTCIGNGYNSCHLLTFQENSVCKGNNATSCTGSIFKSGSICYANVEGACGSYYNSSDGITYDSIYEDDACCIGEFCPDYAPICP